MNKAELLLYVKCKNLYATIPEFLVIRYSDWLKSSKPILTKLKLTLCSDIIIRSSAVSEDVDLSNTIGTLSSIIVKDCKYSADLSNAIHSIFEKIIEVLGHDMNHCIIAQNYLSNSILSGVLLTHANNKNYYTINYDDQSTSTNRVTNGSILPKQILVYKHNQSAKILTNKFFVKPLIKAIKEIEQIFPTCALDIEFAIDENKKLYIFQIRILSNQVEINDKNTIKRLNQDLYSIEEFLKEEKLVLSNMADWNPAELIGQISPHFSFSLYKTLITNQTWHDARIAIGYNKNVDSNLMLRLANHPYIDLKKSFRSLIPDNLSQKDKDKLSDIYLNFLLKNKHLHDKVEFQVCISGWGFTLEEKFKLLNIVDSELKLNLEIELFKILKNGLSPEGCLYQSIKAIKHLDKLSKSVSYNRGIKGGAVNSLNYLIHITKKATYNFSVIARYAFIAEDILRDLVKLNIFTIHNEESFKASLNSIEKRFLKDIMRLKKGSIKLDTFLKKYGHLRPDTYNVVKPNLVEVSNIFDSNFDDLIMTYHRFRISENTKKSIEKLLKLYALNIGVNNFIKFIKDSIVHRENAKFVFTKFVSDTIAIVRDWAINKGITSENVAYLDIEDIIKYDHLDDIFLKNLIKKNADEMTYSELISLPSLITNWSDIYIGEEVISSPNFVTKQIIIAESIHVKDLNIRLADLTNKILLIERADPGYDFIFSAKIAGVITKYGGSNSHLTLRCSELHIPAAIGCGTLFDNLTNCKRLKLNCRDKAINHDFWNNC